MIKITHKTINESVAANALFKLTRLTNTQASSKVGHRADTAVRKIREEIKWGEKQALELALKYAEKDEKGYPKRNEKNPDALVFKHFDDEKAHDKEFVDTILMKEIELPIDPVSIRDLTPGVLTFQEIGSLEWFFSDANDEEVLEEIEQAEKKRVEEMQERQRQQTLAAKFGVKN